MDILIATLVVGVIGLLIGLALVEAGKKFRVEVDEREVQVRECLPGNNCGACGYAGCDAVAAAIVKGEAPANACPVASDDVSQKIGAIMGVEAGATARKVAFVKCAGTCEHSPVKGDYVGIEDCRAAALAGVSVWACRFGCMGYGSCVKACNYDAIRVTDGVAAVDASKCVGCGLCAAACPKQLIELIPAGVGAAVRCSNPDKGVDVKKVCSAGCIACKICEKQCETGAIQVSGGVAHVDYGKCSGCGKCAEKCPTNVIQKR